MGKSIKFQALEEDDFECAYCQDRGCHRCQEDYQKHTKFKKEKKDRYSSEREK